MTKRLLINVLAILLLFMSILAQAGELFSGKIYTQPEKIYVNQPFKIIIEVAVTPGQAIENIKIQGFPNDPDFITLGQLESNYGRSKGKAKQGQTADLLHFHANARCHRSIALQFNPILTCDLIRRRSGGFFSFSSSSQKLIRIDPLKLVIHELPKTGKPIDFSGAIGKFRLTGSLSRTKVRPGDIITQKLDLNGTGWLNSCTMPSQAVSKEFKCYPPKETLRRENRVTSEQVFIPLSTNAVELASASFSYFNPETECYEACSSPVFKLQFIAEAEPPVTNQVKLISTDSRYSSAQTPSVSINIKRVNTAFHQMLPAIIGCVSILATSFFLLALMKFNKWLAAIISIATLTTGAFFAFKAAHYQPAAEVKITKHTSIYMAPSVNSPVIMQLNPETMVTTIENTERWIRVESSGQRGWIQHNNVTMPDVE